MQSGFWPRLRAMIAKEFIQMRRDFNTIAMVLLIPLIQILIFGYAINTNPKHLPTALILSDQSEYTRKLLAAVENTEYFNFVTINPAEEDAAKMLAQDKIQFILSIPPDFTKKLLRHENPTLLLEADTTDPVATTSAISVLNQLSQTIFSTPTTPFELRVHSLYNPSAITQYNIVPGVLGVVLTLSLVMINAMAITKEKELGTMENLLATPLRSIEVIIGKITPYLLVGYLQIIVVILLGYFLFHIPMYGSLTLLLVVSFPFVAVNLAVGLALSTLAKNQLQADTGSVFFFLPSVLLSGFLFPFYGMPQWAQYIGSCLPLTYYLRIIRGIMLKGNTFIDIWPNLWPMIVILIVTTAIAMLRYQKTLD